MPCVLKSRLAILLMCSLDMVVRTCLPQGHPGPHSGVNFIYDQHIGWDAVLLLKYVLKLVQWCSLEVPASSEAEAGGSKFKNSLACSMPASAN